MFLIDPKLDTCYVPETDTYEDPESMALEKFAELAPSTQRDALWALQEVGDSIRNFLRQKLDANGGKLDVTRETISEWRSGTAKRRRMNPLE